MSFRSGTVNKVVCARVVPAFAKSGESCCTNFSLRKLVFSVTLLFTWCFQLWWMLQRSLKYISFQDGVRSVTELISQLP